MITIANKRITSPGQMGLGYTPDDGLGLCMQDAYYVVTNCIIDMTGRDCDEAVAITWGAQASFTDCVFRGASKLVLCGSGDADKRNIESKRRVIFNHCLFENFGRRGPEVQSSMVVELNDCVIRNWAQDDHFNTRSFACWAHDGGLLIANNCAFIQDSISRSFSNTIVDICNHIGQRVNDGGLLALLKPKTYLPGVCRGLIASDGGCVTAHDCCKNVWWIRTDAEVSVDKDKATLLLGSFSDLL